MISSRLNSKRLHGLTVLALLCISVFAPLFANLLSNITVLAEVQNRNEMVVARYGSDISTVDPARSYDSDSGSLIGNVYETLIRFDGESVDEFVPCLATEWTVSSDGLTYTFKIREDVKFHNNDTLTTEDVEYSFERSMVFDNWWGPAWMLYEPLLNCSHANVTDPNFGEKIDNAIQRNETHVWFNLTLGQPPYAPFLSILAGGYSTRIVNKNFSIAHGCWPGTWNNWTSYHDPAVSPLDDPEPVMCGTGPYMFDYWNPGVEWSLVKFDDYWNGWPAPGSDDFVERATTKLVYDWTQRKNMFLNGTADMISVERTNVNEVLGEPGVRCIYPLDDLSCYAVFFTFNVSVSSQCLGPGFNQSDPYVIAEDRIRIDFMSDMDVRKGFAYAINYTKVISDIYSGEASQPATPVISGLPFHNPAQEKYSINLTKAQEYFESAWGGNIWSQGFNMTIRYPDVNWRQLVCSIIKANVESLNTKFHIQTELVDFSSEYNPQYMNGELPIFMMGWSADYSDPHDFVQPFMHSTGLWAACQRYANSTVDGLIEDGISTSNTTERRDIYYQLQSLYHEDCPGVPLTEPLGRHWERTWVQGWYHNPILPGPYFYPLWKDSVNPYQMIVASIGEPWTLDPARSYDSASGQLISNVYETLISFDRGNISEFVPCLATEWHISSDGLTYTFKIREDVKFHNGDVLTTEDVEYSFERVMVVDQSGGPEWMLYEPLLGRYHADMGWPENETCPINTAVERNSTHVWFNLISPYTPFLSILAGGYGTGVVNKDFCIAHGDWPGTWNNWTSYHDPAVSPLDDPEPVMCGTGPYMFGYWTPNVEWQVYKFDDYWGGWPAPDSDGYVSICTVKNIQDWGTRRDMFLDGDVDICDVPREYISQVEGQPGIRCFKDLPPAMTNPVMLFGFNISDTSPYLGPGFNQSDPYVIAEDRIRIDFMSDIDVRKGFAYGFDYDTFILDMYGTEAKRQYVCVPELFPYFNPSQTGYDFNLTKAEEHFRAAWGGQLWTSGFNMTILYNTDTTNGLMRQRACEILKANIESLNSLFHIDIKEVNFGAEYIPALFTFELPLFIIGWVADYADPHNFVNAFMHTYGDFTYFQRYSNATVDALIEDGVSSNDSTERQEIYYELQSLYVEDVPSVPLAYPLERHWERTWVQGWYYNPMHQGTYFYHLWKETILHVDPASMTVSTGEEFTVNVTLQYVEDLYAFQFFLSFDNTQLNCTGIDYTGYLNEPVFIAAQGVNNTGGYAFLAVTSMAPASGKTCGGALATVHFKCIAPGNSTLHLYNTALVHSLIRSISHGTRDREVENAGSMLYVNPASTTVTVGEEFTVNVTLDYAEDLYAYEFWLSFDNTQLNATDVEYTGYLGTQPYVDHLILMQLVNNTGGYVTLAVSRLGANPPITGGGVLATVHFKCLAAGNSTLHLYDTYLSDDEAKVIPDVTVDGEVTQMLANLLVEGVVVASPCTVYANDTYWDGSAYYVPVNVTVENAVGASCSFNVSLTVYWISGSLTEDSVEWRVYGLNPGENVTLTYMWRPQHTGYYNLTAVADCDSEIAEINEDDDTLVLQDSPVALQGDVNGDHTVNIMDAVVVCLAWGATPSDPQWNTCADLDHNSLINIMDAVRICIHWGQTWP